MEFVLEGNKRLIVQGGTVKIMKKAGLLSAAREKVLPIRNITSVEVKKPGAFFVGFIQFSIAGGAARDSSYTLSGGAFDAVSDENSVVFGGEENYQMAIRIRDYIEQYSQPTESRPSQTYSAADEVLKLKSLMDDGILTRDEFESKKQQLLAL